MYEDNSGSQSILIWFLFVVMTLWLCLGCSTPKGLERRSERLKIAHERKGVYIPKDTVRTTDTIISRIAIGDTVFITKEITKTLEPKIEYKTKREIKWKDRVVIKEKKIESAAKSDSLDALVKLEKEKTKQAEEETKKAKAENWGFWDLFGFGALLFLVGLGCGFLLKIFLTLRS